MEDAIKSIEKCTFNKGDVLIITASRRLCDRERRYIHESAEKALPEGVSMLILDDGMEAKVLTGKEYHGPLVQSDQYVSEN